MTQAGSKIVKVNETLSVDEGHGLVFGWAIVCKVWNETTGAYEDYFDLNVDQEGIHKGERVPENITEDAVIDAYVEVRKNDTSLPGNDMHVGPDSGVHYDLIPMTEEIAKGLGGKFSKTGLICIYKPEPDILQKFKDGTYTGFSIEGGRIDFDEITEEAA